MLFFLSVLFLCLICVVLFYDYYLSKDKFSAVKLVSYFSFIEAFSLLWFSLRRESLDLYVTSPIDSSLVRDEYIVEAYFMSIVIYFFIVSGVFSFNYLFKIKEKIVLRLNSFGFEVGLIDGFLILFFGFILYFIFLAKIGGFLNLWGDISERTTLSAGLGYYQYLYTLFIYIGCSICYVFFVKNKKYLLAALLILLCSLVMASLGQRSPLALLFFTLILVHHYHVKAFESVFNFKLIIISIFLVVFMFSFVQLRPNQGDIPFLDKFERDVLQRLSGTDSKVAVIGYFDKHDYWGWGVYESLLYAPISSVYYEKKPPVDTGVYINTIRQGFEITPPLPAKSVDRTSWPDGVLAGYTSFGYLGLIFISFLSGGLYGFIYNFLINLRRFLPITVMYSFVGFMGALPLSPFGVVSFCMAMLSFLLVILLVKIRLFFSRRII